MKHIKYLIFAFLLMNVNISMFAVSHHNHTEEIEHENYNSEYDIQLSKLQTVYICTGSYSYAYHSNSTCSGLNNCKGEINYTDEYSAVNSFGRRACCKCWSNVSGNCKDDNPYYGGGSGGGSNNSDAYAYLALAVVATSAIILSNDFYFYPTCSFYNPIKDNNQYGQLTNSGIGTGWIFGFRKTFKNSALEYGASYLKYESKYNYNYGYTGTNVQDRWGGHFNFVHNIFYNKTPDWLKVYTGPSINYVYDLGFGAIIGTEMKLLDRLRFDVRYELTTQTNQIQGGLIFTYQKKYFWQK